MKIAGASLTLIVQGFFLDLQGKNEGCGCRLFGHCSGLLGVSTRKPDETNGWYFFLAKCSLIPHSAPFRLLCFQNRLTFLLLTIPIIYWNMFLHRVCSECTQATHINKSNNWNNRTKADPNEPAFDQSLTSILYSDPAQLYYCTQAHTPPFRWCLTTQTLPGLLSAGSKTTYIYTTGKWVTADSNIQSWMHNEHRGDSNTRLLMHRRRRAYRKQRRWIQPHLVRSRRGRPPSCCCVGSGPCDQS